RLRRLQRRARAGGRAVTRVLGVGLLTGWGAGVAALPEDARRAAGDRRVVPLVTPPLAGERFRRATRECLLGVAAVEAALRESGRADTALVLAVETFDECADLWARGRWAAPRPLVEAAACAVLVGSGDDSGYGPGAASTLEALVARRAGETLACAPLVGLA